MAQEIPEEIKGLIYSQWLPQMMAAVLEAVGELPTEQRNVVLARMDRACKEMAMAGAVGIRPGMSWDEYAEFVKSLPSPVGPWEIEQSGDVYDLTYESSVADDGRPRCHCPLVLLGLLEPVPEMCTGGADLAASMIEAAAGKPVIDAEVVGSPLRTGEACCRYRVRVGPG